MRYLFLIISLLFCLVGRPALAIDMDKIVEQAKDLQLATSPTWLALLHYKKETFGGVFQSQADGAEFFLSENGKTDPFAELIADLNAFVEPSAANHAQCRFPARWFWLKSQLNITSAEYDVACPKLQDWLDRADADQLTLVFPAMYLNNPGSMFGHTFIRFDNAKKSDLLSYTLNYSAKIDSSDGIFTYVYNGLTGGYSGIFGIRPYYETVQLYSDIENRDIWEYRLDYSPEEITQLLRHVWEVTDIRFDYFFLNENCAYRLLSLLDAVKPEARLSSTDVFPVYAIPVDTVRALENKGLIQSRKFRPSLVTQIEQTSMALSAPLNEMAVLLADQEISIDELKQKVTDEKQRALVLEQTYTLLQFREQASTELASQILSERSHLPETPKQHYAATKPETGHTSVLAAVGVGEVRDNKNIRFQLRPAFHSLLDDPAGYVEGAEITVLDTELSWLTEQDKLQLEKLTFFSVTSLSPLKRWEKPWSWKLNIALERTALSTSNTTLAFLASGGAGASLKWADMIYFVMADIEVNASKQYAKGYAAMFGWSGGLVYPFRLGQLKLEYQDVDSVAGAGINRLRTSAAVNFNLSREMSVQFNYELNEYEFFEVDEWGVRVNWYF